MNENAEFDGKVIFTYFFLWYLFTIITSGTAAPLGIFLPCMIIGCALGHFYGNIELLIYPDEQKTIVISSYAIIGAAAVLSGSTRMSFSLSVIMLETTSDVNLFIPVIFSLFVSYGVGRIFTKSLYSGTLRAKNIPILGKDVPKVNEDLYALNIMSTPVETLDIISTVEKIG